MGQSGLRNWGSASQRWAWSLGDLGFHLALFINISVSSLKSPNLSGHQLPPPPPPWETQRASLPAHLSENWGKAGFALPWPWGGALFQEGRVPWAPVVWLVPVLSKCPPSRSAGAPPIGAQPAAGRVRELPGRGYVRARGQIAPSA